MSGKTYVKSFLSTDLLKKESMRQDRTAILWMQHMDRIDILRWFITFERTGNWVMYFQAMKEMLP